MYVLSYPYLYYVLSFYCKRLETKHYMAMIGNLLQVILIPIWRVYYYNIQPPGNFLDHGTAVRCASCPCSYSLQHKNESRLVVSHHTGSPHAPKYHLYHASMDVRTSSRNHHKSGWHWNSAVAPSRRVMCPTGFARMSTFPLAVPLGKQVLGHPIPTTRAFGESL